MVNFYTSLAVIPHPQDQRHIIFHPLVPFPRVRISVRRPRASWYDLDRAGSKDNWAFWRLVHSCSPLTRKQSVPGRFPCCPGRRQHRQNAGMYHQRWSDRPKGKVQMRKYHLRLARPALGTERGLPRQGSHSLPSLLQLPTCSR